MNKITIEAATLAKILNGVKEVARRDDAIPIVNTVLVRVDGGKLAVRTSSFDMQIERTISLDQPDCAFCVDARRFASIASAMPSGSQVQIDVEDGHIIVKGGRSRFRLATLKADDFPQLPFDGKQSFDLDAEFFNALALCRPGVSTNVVMTQVTGVFVGDRADATWIMASDGNILFGVDFPAKGMPEMLLATATVDLVCRLASECRLDVQEGRVRFAFGDTVVIAKTIDSTFPQLVHLIPRETPVTVKFEGDDALAALNRISLVAEDKDRTVRVSFKANSMLLTNRSAGDEGSEEVPCDLTGEPLDAAFRLSYLRAALNAIDADEAVWSLTDAASPTKIANPKRPTVNAVVMPTR